MNGSGVVYTASMGQMKNSTEVHVASCKMNAKSFANV